MNLRHQVKRILIKAGYHLFPSFIIIGAQKSGTTYLYSLLRQHPDIIEPVNKEAHFFDYQHNYDRGSIQYKTSFDLSYRHPSNGMTFEATPDYLACPSTPSRVAKMFPDMKFVVILRNPTSRAFSAWKMHHFEFKNHPKYNWLHDQRNTFQQVIDDAVNGEMDRYSLMNHIERGMYGEQFELWLNYFKREQFLVIFQSELKKDAQSCVDKICEHVALESSLCIDEVDFDDKRFWGNVASEKTAKVQLLDSQRVELDTWYKDDKVKLQKQLDIEVVEW